MSLKDHTITGAEVAREWARAYDKVTAELQARERQLAKAEREIEGRDCTIARLRTRLRRVAAMAKEMGEVK